MLRRLRALAWVALTPLALVSGKAARGAPPPWTAPGEPPLSDELQSAVVDAFETHVVSAPDARAPLRGAAMRGARLPLFAARRGPGCRAPWLLVGPDAWTCGEGMVLSREPPVPADAAPRAELGLPFRYLHVGRDGSLGYRRLEGADVDEPAVELHPGFGVSVVEEKRVGGERYARTRRGLWIPMRDLLPVRPLDFRGEELPPGAPLNFGWVVVDRAPVHLAPTSRARTAETRARFARVPVLEVQSAGGRSFVRVGEKAWLSSEAVRRPSTIAPPQELLPGERWIDVELASQTLVAYEAERPVFATLVSTGRPGRSTETPRGVFRIWVKLLASNMDNLEDEEATRTYAIEDVPWVQYFSRGVGLHGTFWHRQFGHVKSHGCVNLTPLDAARLFAWTSPRLPAGHSAIFPGRREPGTLVRVR